MRSCDWFLRDIVCLQFIFSHIQAKFYEATVSRLTISSPNEYLVNCNS